jgi:site-specific DNA recombinase
MPNANGHDPQSNTDPVALLLRVSSEEQRDRETIQIQDEFLRQYSDLYGLDVAGIYSDDGVSGTIPLHERPEGRRLLEDAREGKFKTVLVYKLDRLGRSLLVIVDAHDRLQEAGVALRSATEPIDTSTPSGRLIFQMLASFAEYERETIGERTRAGFHRALRNGKFPGRLPYGYRLSPDERGLEIVEEEAAVVREIIANIAEGSTLYAESKRLNDEGIPSPGRRYKSGERKHGPTWSRTTVADFVHQSAYSGVHRVQIGKEGQIIEREVPPIVDPGLQDRAVAALGTNKRRASPVRKNARKYLLSGLARCGVCGLACSGRTTPGEGKDYSYYACLNNRGERGQERRVHPRRPPSVSAPYLEGLVWADVRGFITNPGEVLERVRDQLGGEGNTKDLDARLKSLSRRLTAKQSEKDRYIRLYAQEHISEDELETYLADLKNQISNLRLLIEATEADLSQRRERAELANTTYAWLTALRERAEEIEEDTPEAFLKRQQLVRLLVERIVVGRDHNGDTTVEITYRFGPPDDTTDGGQGFAGDIRNSSPNLRSR